MHVIVATTEPKSAVHAMPRGVRRSPPSALRLFKGQINSYSKHIMPALPSLSLTPEYERSTRPNTPSHGEGPLISPSCIVSMQRNKSPDSQEGCPGSTFHASRTSGVRKLVGPWERSRHLQEGCLDMQRLIKPPERAALPPFCL